MIKINGGVIFLGLFYFCDFSFFILFFFIVFKFFEVCFFLEFYFCDDCCLGYNMGCEGCNQENEKEDGKNFDEDYCIVVVNVNVQ